MTLRCGHLLPLALLQFGLASLQGCDSLQTTTQPSALREPDGQATGGAQSQDRVMSADDNGPANPPPGDAGRPRDRPKSRPDAAPEDRPKDPEAPTEAQAERDPPTDAEALGRAVAAALEKSAGSMRVEDVTEDGWIWIAVELHDETYPLTVDVVASRNAKADHIVYMLPGGSVNFGSSFFTPRDRNLAHFMRERGGLIVGISAREDNVPSTLEDYSFMAGWGLAKHRADIRSVVSAVQSVTALPYDLLGHSYGASCALDYAANDAGDLRRLIVLDIYSMAPGASLGVEAAERTYQAHVALMSQGVYHDTSYADTKTGANLAELLPDVDSGVSRADAGYPGNFLLEAYLYYSLINTAPLPGIHTPITDLPGDWLMKQSMLAGQYTLAQNPRADRFSFDHTQIETFRESAAKIGGGLVPVALERDFWAVNAGNPDYVIPFQDIKAEVIWLNAELGYAEHSHAAQQIEAGGNQRVTTAIIPGYGHGDMIWSATAAADVWSMLHQD
jgi:pimeloyl-ACP methyl ester carboxylesterase